MDELKIKRMLSIKKEIDDLLEDTQKHYNIIEKNCEKAKELLGELKKID